MVVVKDLAEKEAARAEEEAGLGLGKVCTVGGTGIGRRRFLGAVVVLKRKVLEAGFLKGIDNKLLLGFLKVNKSFCITSIMHFPQLFIFLFLQLQETECEREKRR